jgi:D-alanyl-D-alanine endopeptidase (penicillin-binding protein 7)
MTAMVTLDANLPMDEMVPIGEDNPNIKRSKSRLKVGVCLSRRELLQLALMSSENRAALALANSYPGGLEAFLIAMNLKAAQLEMSHTVFFDPTGLDLRNVSTAQDLVKMVVAASSYSVIHDFTTTSSREVDDVGTRKPLKYHNTNPLVSTSQWDIGLSKTGYIKEAGRCLVMQTVINGSPVVIVILHSRTKRGRVTDAKIIKNWVEKKLPITIKDEMILPPVPPASPFLPEDVPMCTAVQPVPSLTM